MAGALYDRPDVSLKPAPWGASMQPMTTPKPKKKPGRNIPNAQRHTIQVLLRLPPEHAERIEELADQWRLTKSGVVGRLLEAHDEDEEG